MDRLLKSKKRGSLTIEACISLPVFACFFLLLAFFIQTACINHTLQQTASETAKQLAVTCYPIHLLNELEDELLQDQQDVEFPVLLEDLKNELVPGDGPDAGNIFNMLLPGRLGKDQLDGMINSLVQTVGCNVGRYFTNELAHSYFKLKSQAKVTVAKQLIRRNISGGLIDPERITLKWIEIPQSFCEYGEKCKNEEYKKLYKNLGVNPEPDDVVIAIEYRMSVPFKLFGKKEFTARAVAVEKAWLNGSNGVYTVDEASSSDDPSGNGEDNNESSNDQNDEDSNFKTVYKTTYGEKYHNTGCRYLAKSCIPIGLNEAKAIGLTPCKVCVLKTAKDWRKRK